MDNNNELMVFNNKEFGQLQICTINGKEYFGATNTAKMLGYANPYDAIGRHCKKNGVVKHEVIDNMGRPQEINLITEGNLYRLVAKSKLPKAEEFESWVFDEVLPSLRKRGVYIMEHAKEETIDNEKSFGKNRVKKTFANAKIHTVEKLYEDCINYINEEYSTKDKIKMLQSVYNGLSELNLKLAEDAVRNVGKCYDISLLQHRVLQDKAKYQNKRNGGIKSSKTKEIDKQSKIIKDQQNIISTLNPSLEDYMVLDIHGMSENYLYETVENEVTGENIVVKTYQYKNWIKKFPSFQIKDKEELDVNWNKPIIVFLKFDCMDKFDVQNLVKSAIDQIITRDMGEDDNIVDKIIVERNKTVDSLEEGRIYICIQNL